MVHYGWECGIKVNDTSPSPQTWVARTFTNPYVGMVGWCASVISIPLAFYFYFASIEKPDLTYYIRPDRSPLVAAGDTPDLAIIYKGHEVSKNVSAAQITIWNAGKKPIQHDEILAPFVISTEANHPILAAKVISVTRPVIGFHLDDSAVGSDRLGIDWRVLEFNDGVLVQVIYEGDTSVPIHVNGSYLGQRTISVRTLPFGYQTDADKNPINKLSRYLRPIAGVTSSMAV